MPRCLALGRSLGRAIRAAVRSKLKMGILAVVGLSNEYISYFATPEDERLRFDEL